MPTDDYRLTPTMNSRTVQVISFCKQYLGRWGRSPSYTEIANKIGISRSGARAIVRRAVERGELQRTNGARRAIELPGDRGEPLAPAEAEQLLGRLRAAGYFVDQDHIAGVGKCTIRTLPPLLELPHIIGDGAGSGDARYDGIGPKSG